MPRKEYIAWFDMPTNGKLHGQSVMPGQELIRCKDCKYYHEDSYGEDEWIMCRRTNLYTDEDKYCAWAERLKNGSD